VIKLLPIKAQQIHELDNDWLELILEAKQMGYTPECIKSYLSQKKK
jgi:hypothetical protein